jgi:hypothetical protein
MIDLVLPVVQLAERLAASAASPDEPPDAEEAGEALHDILALMLRDPPFSRLDLVSCRGLLTDLEHDARCRALARFHHGLRGAGVLLLDASDAAADGSLFGAVDQDHGVFAGLPPGRPAVAASIDPRVCELAAELQRTRERLRITVEQYEASVEELKASNEELQAINDELRHTTSELETSKQELQALNEELIALNHEPCSPGSGTSATARSAESTPSRRPGRSCPISSSSTSACPISAATTSRARCASATDRRSTSPR